MLSTLAWCAILATNCVVLFILLLTTPLYDMVSPYQVPIGILCAVGAVGGAASAFMLGG